MAMSRAAAVMKVSTRVRFFKKRSRMWGSSGPMPTWSARGERMALLDSARKGM
jgi:hypothetical protein